MRWFLVLLIVGCERAPVVAPSRLVVCLQPDTTWVYGRFGEKDSTRMIFQECF